MKVAGSGEWRILLVDDEPQILAANQAILRGAGYDNIITLEDGNQVVPLLNIPGPEIGIIVLDLHMPIVSGAELLPLLSADFPHIPVIVMTGVDQIETAVECIKAGAVDYLVKPVESSKFVSVIRRALEIYNLRREVEALKQHLLSGSLKSNDAFYAIITRSRKMQAIFQYVEAVAPSAAPVLITGETGVGKELIAKAIHKQSGRAGKFVPVNVAGLDDDMFSDTLFGHKKGAFTGAVQAREGLVERAENGTLFLDEIGDLNASSQVKLLRLLQENTYYALGSDVERKSNARIVVATNRGLQSMLKDGLFRKDLYYRLCSHSIDIPPLRERAEDVPLLISHFAADASEKANKESPEIPPELIALLTGYAFPGNVRELQTLIFDAVMRSRSRILNMESFAHIAAALTPPAGTSLPPLKQRETDTCLLEEIFGHFPTLSEIETYMQDEALRLSGGNQRIAAAYLGLTRQTFNKRLRRAD
jgi:DNA-binding NtrC family response regulator